MTPPFMAESEEELKSLLMKVKEESEKVRLKLNIQRTKIMASGPITSWQIDGETVKTVADFIFLGSKITADGDCSHEIKRRLLLGRKAMTNLDSILESRDITLPTKIHLVKALVFSSSHVWMWELDYKESWELKNWCFWTVMLEKTLESPLDSKAIQPIHPKSVLTIHWKDWCWSWNANILATWCKELTHWKRPWCWERLKVGGKGNDRGWDGWMASPTWRIWAWVSSGSWWWIGKPGVLQSMGLQSQTWLNDWTELNWSCTLSTWQWCLFKYKLNPSWQQNEGATHACGKAHHLERDTW